MQHLSGLVTELLELARIESGQISMTIEPVGAEQLVREVMARMLPLAQRHRVTLRTEIEQGETLVAADSKQISTSGAAARTCAMESAKRSCADASSGQATSRVAILPRSLLSISCRVSSRSSSS